MSTFHVRQLRVPPLRRAHRAMFRAMRRGRAPVAALACGVGAVAACTPAMREMRQHPVSLAGDWVDLAHATPSDTSVWRLRADGADLTVHVLARPAAGAAYAAAETRPSRHGIWFLRGALADTAARALCFNSRPGRNPTSCVRFALDTLADGTRRLVLRNYRGTHAAATRTLVERRP